MCSITESDNAKLVNVRLPVHNAKIHTSNKLISPVRPTILPVVIPLTFFLLLFRQQRNDDTATHQRITVVKVAP